MTDPTPRLQLDRVSKRYGAAVAVAEVDLWVAEGEFVTFLGQSGSGKTTTLKLIAGFETCDEGAIRLAGADVSGKPPRERDIGMVFQNYALFPHLSVGRNVAYGLRRRGWSKQRAQARVAQMLELTELGAHADKLPRQLSGGQQQRVALARALAPQPQLLLMDEPLGALDRALRLDLEAEIRRVHRSTGCTVLYVTHDRDEALALSDRIAVFHGGRVVGVDTPARLYESPPTAYVARLLTDANLVALPQNRHRDGYAEFALAGRDCRVRAVDPAGDRLAIPRRAIGFGSDGIALPSSVTDLAFLGEIVRVDLRSEALGAVVAHVPSAAAAGLRVGDEVVATLDIDKCAVIA
ncbi:ABC transporter ATP-binding protein [Nocardia panacis]|uniref:ABC-type quaternary amine transporter n=1 Tax=Nocardia panacis TaxID=2340916 RepID=A0A3A4KD87_9NOCA|nr:ABC transporter ATP-binding protein [Nocardia panacis]RJO70825.1 ABC transporter ATP-binding protein [Nocardia panacis]